MVTGEIHCDQTSILTATVADAEVGGGGNLPEVVIVTFGGN